MSDVKPHEMGVGSSGERVEPSDEWKTLTRFPADATPEQKQEFATALVTAMDELEIWPGDEFVILKDEDFQAIRDELATANEENANYEGELARWTEGEDDQTQDIRELLEDIERGLKEMGDLYEYVGLRRP